MTWLLVGIGGAAGSILRYGAGRLAIHFLGPGAILGTFVVNVTGSFALGFFLTFALERSGIPAEVRGMVAIGLLGGYTTFSTFSYDSIRLLESGEVMRAGLNILGHLVISLAAAYAGVLSGRAV